MTTGLGPYVGETATDSDDTGVGSPVIETTLVATRKTVDIGGGVLAHAEVFNEKIPGPTFRLNVGDTMVVRLINDLPYPMGIHWHGLELPNYSDGTEITQSGVPGGSFQTINGAPSGGTFLYRFKVTRAGLYWYHPHHHNSMNQVFRGMYGLIIVTDPLEANIVAPAVGAVLPAAADTMQLVLSDITVSKGVGSVDPTYVANYVNPTTIAVALDRPEWLSGRTDQVGPTPKDLCEIAPGGSATDDHGNAAAASYVAGDVPSLVRGPGRLTEGQTVLTNGVNVGGRLGKPGAPRALAGAVTKDVLSGQGLRLQIVNCAHLRYFRLRLTREDGTIVNLWRIGGEGGLLDKPILEGGPLGSLQTGFDPGEIVLPPATRADVVAAIPPGLPVNSVLTLWTRDYQRAGDNNQGVPNDAAHRNFAQLPSVPVMHLKVTAASGTTYTIGAATALRATAGMPAVETLGAPVPPSLLNPATFGKTGSSSADIQLTTNGAPAIDGLSPLPPAFMDSTPYTSAPHIATSRYAETGKLMELTVTNASSAHHPFHLHGFSFQPRAFEQGGSAVFTWPYREFRDTIDLPPNNTTLRFRVRLDQRALINGTTTPGGELGRWMFHCHIFFHGHHGMMSELVVTTADGKEKPNVNVGGSWAYAPVGGTATRKGTFFQRDGLQMTLAASKGTVLPTGLNPGGNWTWSHTSAPADPPSTEYVYITATDTGGRKDQCVFRLQIGGADNGSDIGDPHIHTVDGKAYDFQAAGEFILLRDRDGMELQVRQTPVETPPPIKDNYSELTVCVSVNTAFAARIGSHRIAFQPFRDRTRVQFLLDGKPAELPKQGMNLGGDRVSAFAAGGETALRIDYAHGPVVTVTPRLWTYYGVWLLDVAVSKTNADEGIMGRIHKGTWLPNLPGGATVGPKPASLHDRYVALYKTFADAWRVTDQTSMFAYTPFTSTATFTDRDWPREKPPCTLSPAFPKPVNPILKNIGIEKAERVCKAVTDKDLHDNCVFDVATTGDETFAKNYLVAQELRLRVTAVQIVGDKPQTRFGEALTVTATVLPITAGRPVPKGSVTFLVDDVEAAPSVKLDKDGRATSKMETLRDGAHRIRALYTPEGDTYDASSSPNLLHDVERQSRTGKGTGKGAPYEMRGVFYEACDCFTVCPCWLGNGPDGGECTGVFAWEIEAGSIDGVDVGGLLTVSVSHHTGMREKAKQQVMIFVDDRATRQQADALSAAFSGTLGGPLQELGDLLGELLGVERAPIELRREGRLTTLTVDRRIRVEGTAREGPTGRITLTDGKLSNVLGSPAEVGESGRLRVSVAMATEAMNMDVRGRSTMSGRFSYTHVPGPGTQRPVPQGPVSPGSGTHDPGH